MNTTVLLILSVSAVVSYLIGGVNAAIIMSKLLHHEDIREKGSKNPGFTNYKRVYGMSPAAVFVMLADILKAMLCAGITAWILKDVADMWQVGAQVAGLFCMLGHCFPVWYGFKGGKAFMTGFGTAWLVDWRMTLIAMTIFLILLFTVKYMSVSSCVASLVCPVVLLFLGVDHPAVQILSFVAAALVIVRHYPNFIKLKNGTESKFSLINK